MSVMSIPSDLFPESIPARPAPKAPEPFVERHWCPNGCRREGKPNFANIATGERVFLCYQHQPDQAIRRAREAADAALSRYKVLSSAYTARCQDGLKWERIEK